MSNQYFKKTVKCDCGCDYGSNCGKVIAFIQVLRGVSDTYSLTVNYDYNNPESEFESLGCWNESAMHALTELLKAGAESPENITEKDILKTKDVY